MATHFGPGSLGVPFPSRRRYQEEDPLEAKSPTGWEDTILHMKRHGISNPWRLAAALMTAAATERRSCQELVQDAVTGDATAACQVAATCRILGLLSI